RRLPADAVVHESEGERAEPGRYVEHDAEQQDLLRREAERPGGVDASEREDRHEAVVVEQAGGEETDDLAESADLAERLAELAHRRGEHPAGRRDGSRPLLADAHAA